MKRLIINFVHEEVFNDLLKNINKSDIDPKHYHIINNDNGDTTVNVMATLEELENE
jgi:hypothetical protein